MSALASKVSTEPIQLACAFNLPMIIVVTHIDVVSEQKMRDTIYNVKLALKQMSVEKVVSVIRTTEDAVLFSQIVAS
jgi:GTPase